MSRMHAYILIPLTLLLLACLDCPQETSPHSPPSTAPTYSFRVLHTYPHDSGSFTQGLVFHNGSLYEGTGRRGKSMLQRIEIETGQPMQTVSLPETAFGEGIAIWNDLIYQLTWKSHTCFVYNLDTFKTLKTLTYKTQGWGLTTNGHHLILSDGSHALYFLDPDTFQIQSQINAHDANGPISNLNELEFIDGFIYANIWNRNYIAKISPETGEVFAWIDLSGLYRPPKKLGKEAVLNGIAWNDQTGSFYVTGKLWPVLFEIEVVSQEETPGLNLSQ